MYGLCQSAKTNNLIKELFCSSIHFLANSLHSFLKSLISISSFFLPFFLYCFSICHSIGKPWQSQPGIYKEFEDEDGLRTEVLKKYIKLSAEPVHKNYDSYKLYPNHLFNHFDAIINDGNKNLTKDKNYLQIKRPRNAIGCLMERTRLNSELLGPKAKKLIKTFNTFRIECFKKYVRNAQADGKFKKNLNPQYTAEYILAQFNMIQTYRLNGIKKNRIESILETALKPILV